LSYAPLTKIYHKVRLGYHAVSHGSRESIPAGLHRLDEGIGLPADVSDALL